MNHAIKQAVHCCIYSAAHQITESKPVKQVTESIGDEIKKNIKKLI